jgi:hypothetical protein
MSTHRWKGAPAGHADPARRRIKLTSPNLISFCGRLPDGPEKLSPPA